MRAATRFPFPFSLRPFLTALRRGVVRALLAVEDVCVPPVCEHCGRRRVASLPLCRACLRVLRDARPEEDEAVTGLPWVRALFRLSPPLHVLIHGFKYRNRPGRGRLLAEWMRWRAAWRADLAAGYDAVVPVPLHATRRRERGYNQAERFARALVRGVPGASVRARALARVRATGTQTRLGGERRGRNLDGAFRARPESVAGARLLLVDDVCTTGSTLSHCREALMAAGAARVDALVIAWVERPRGGDALPDFSGTDGIETAAGFFA